MHSTRKPHPSIYTAPGTPPGNLFDHEFTISRGGQTVATVSKGWFSMRDTYAVDVAPGQDDVLVLASVLALDLAEDREREQH